MNRNTVLIFFHGQKHRLIFFHVQKSFLIWLYELRCQNGVKNDRCHIKIYQLNWITHRKVMVFLSLVEGWRDVRVGGVSCGVVYNLDKVIVYFSYQVEKKTRLSWLRDRIWLGCLLDIRGCNLSWGKSDICQRGVSLKHAFTLTNTRFAHWEF